VRKVFILAVCFLVFFQNNLSAQQALDDETLKKGIYLFRQENYDEALEIFKEEVKQQPESSLAAYYLGLTYKRTENYIAAKKYLKASLELTPKIKGALIELIDLLYRLNEFDAAKKWIKIAEEEGVRPAQAKFLKGLTLQKNGEYEEAVGAFEEAKDLDERLALSANYQVGVCFLRMKRYRDARDIFEDIFEVVPYSDVGAYANRYVDALERKLEKERPFHFGASFAFEYDSNVLLQPTDTALLVAVTDKDDTREVYGVWGDYTCRTEDNFLSLKAGYGLRISKQNELGNYDYMGNNVLVQGNVAFDKVLVTFPLTYNHTTVAGKNYLSSLSVGNINNFMIAKDQMVQMGLMYIRDDYLRRPALSAENRSGNEVMAMVSWFHFFANNEGFVNLRYLFNKDWTKGSNWDFYGNKIGASVLYPVWDKIKLSVNGEIFFQDFNNTNTIYVRKRRDRVLTAGAFLSYEFLKNIELQFRYTYINEYSNLVIYKYNRFIASTGIQCRF